LRGLRVGGGIEGRRVDWCFKTVVDGGWWMVDGQGGIFMIHDYGYI
jgi:hypothetical protein